MTKSVTGPGQQHAVQQARLAAELAGDWDLGPGTTINQNWLNDWLSGAEIYTINDKF